MTDFTAFCRRIEQLLRDNFPDREFTLDADAGTITSDSLRFGMANLFAEFRESSASEDEFDQAVVENLRKAIEMTASTETLMPERWEDAKDRLRPQLSFAGIHELEDAVFFPFSDDVRSAIVVDAPNGYAYVKRPDAERWGKSTIELLEVARKNLWDASVGMQVSFVPEPVKLLILQSSDGYDAARILLPGMRKMLLEKVAESRDGEVFAGIPNRDFLIAWPVDAPAKIDARIRNQIAADATKQHHPLTGTPLRITLDKIEPLE